MSICRWCGKGKGHEVDCPEIQYGDSLGSLITPMIEITNRADNRELDEKHNKRRSDK